MGGLQRGVDKLILSYEFEGSSRVILRNGVRLRAPSAQKLQVMQSAHDRGGGFTRSTAVSRGCEGDIDTTLTPPPQCGATQCKAQKRDPFGYAGSAKIMQPSATHELSLVAGAGQRFESARRLFRFGLDAPNAPHRAALRLKPATSETTEPRSPSSWAISQCKVQRE